MSSRKSSLALQVSLKLFVEQFPQATVWTLTFKERHSPQDALLAWNHLRRAWENYADYHTKSSLCGIRVLEPHPRGHGAHLHVVADKGYFKPDIERLGAQWGFGWFWAEKFKQGESQKLGQYIAKGLYRYLSKFESAEESWHGVRRWATFGGFQGVPVGQLIIDGPFQRLHSQVVATVGHRLSFTLIRELYFDFRAGLVSEADFKCGDWLESRRVVGKEIS